MFLYSKCTFRVLSEDLKEALVNFDCGHSDLNDFFMNDSFNYANELIGKTYCFTLDNDPNEIICAFSIANDSIKVNDLPNSRKKKIIKTIPRVKHISSYPAVLIGRLGVNQKYQRKGIGQELMDFIKSWFIHEDNKTGCRFIVVDSYNAEIPLEYYKKNDFTYIFSTEEQEKKFIGLNETDELKTRLLYFDLILLKA